MELENFAERVLFSTSLKDKLAPPERAVTDENRRSGGMPTPPAPGRPETLLISRDGSRADVPSSLNSDKDRGVLLHFLANHELLATELMALVLLKFPDAPEAFRKGVLRTLLEEQEHTRLYMSRMEECGVAFGDHPVSGYFWNVVSPMETPLDYVSRLSLTFEQANLDFSRYYGRLFEEAGDEQTAAVLERVYHDEIAHVGYGAKWFKRWGGDLDFESFAAQLPSPLSPARAKADQLYFNVEGRLKAGLDSEFVERLRLYRRSKGRTPNVFLYNPQAETKAGCAVVGRAGAVDQGGIMQKMEQDLASIVGVLGSREDVVLSERPPSPAFIDSWMDCGFTPPEFLTREELRKSTRRLNSLRPWAWEPDSFALREAVEERWAPNARHPESWSAQFASLYGKGTWEIEDGVVCETFALVERCCEEFRAKGYARLVLKAAYGLAGRGLIHLLPDDELNEKRIQKLLIANGSLVVEPWYERVFDFSAQYDFTNEELQFRGICHLLNDEFGRFRGIEVGNRWRRKLSSATQRWLGESGVLRAYQEDIPKRLAGRLREVQFTGGLGIDAFVYLDRDGNNTLRKVCEINPRITMGRIALACAKKTGWRNGRLELTTQRDLKDGESFADFYRSQEGTRLPLNDPEQAEVCLLSYREV